ncbi:glycosyl hydrolase family 8 [Neorhizobium sp. Rsf11]|uniref:cellulase n=2 Tax=Neorhizobium TaxID=1525371 RepID=A0ABV0M7G6_9HYPH|nr:glycosyl hydrolase family 8 [Neorhizobium petrolearium]MCC2613961.1 endoglucanase [Neorhizobium petrolearium]WGI71482.1 glycosyl hydrolase family 8 [Neorhizobium petrolearium]
MKDRPRWIIIGMFALAVSVSSAAAQQPHVSKEFWSLYKARFLNGSGRIVDNANGDISHSEGQGYGLLLSFLADNPADFEQIWSFTRTELLIRDDGLAAWKWDPAATPHVTDSNNATDGDILIAYALALAGSSWHRLDYVEQAVRIANSLLSHTVVGVKGQTVLLPATAGFGAGEREDAPVINPSYWIFEALPVMALLAPSDDWAKLSEDGLALLRVSQFGPRRLPAEWESLAQKPKPAAGFPQEFGYNAVRIPLYLMRANIYDRDLLTRLSQGMTNEGGTLSTIDLETGRTKEPLSDPGYQIINHVIGCVLNGTKLPASVQQFEPILYYPSTLQLLALAFVRERHPECL